jgi:hypothetical protein
MISYENVQTLENKVITFMLIDRKVKCQRWILTEKKINNTGAWLNHLLSTLHKGLWEAEQNYLNYGLTKPQMYTPWSHMIQEPEFNFYN